MPEIFNGDGIGQRGTVLQFPHQPVFGPVPGMPRIGLSRGVTELQGDLCPVLALKGAGRTAVAQHQEAAVPAGFIRKAQPEPDAALPVVGVGDHALHLAVADAFVDPVPRRRA